MINSANWQMSCTDLRCQLFCSWLRTPSKQNTRRMSGFRSCWHITAKTCGYKRDTKHFINILPPCKVVLAHCLAVLRGTSNTVSLLETSTTSLILSGKTTGNNQMLANICLSVGLLGHLSWNNFTFVSAPLNLVLTLFIFPKNKVQPHLNQHRF